MDASWHIDETMRIGQSLGFDFCAALCLVLGNVEVDLKYWAESPMHAMTPANAITGKAEETPQHAEGAWRQFIDDCRENARAALAHGQDCEALYCLGQALHATQDREVHRGMTAPEHAVLGLTFRSPDRNIEGQERGKRRSLEFLEDFMGSIPAEDAERLKYCSYDGIAALRTWERKFSIDLVGYTALGLRFWLSRREYEVVRWPDEAIAS